MTNLSLQEKIKQGQSGILVYGITPPKKNTELQRVAEIARTQIERLSALPIDGLILYDIQDEKSRTAKARPFPFLETLDCYEYAEQYLSELALPKILYRSVGKYSPDQLSRFIENASVKNHLSVFVGAASESQQVSLSMAQAYSLKQSVNQELLLGGVAIPERHYKKGDEHLRVHKKIQQGCSFFVSQGVYDVNASKNFLSDYYYHNREHGLEPMPILFTLTPCGSIKTLEFMKWLGISIPRWLENDLAHSEDILEKSIEFSYQNWLELQAFAHEKGLPIGCNVESVAVRKVEIEASIELLKRVKQSMA